MRPHSVPPKAKMLNVDFHAYMFALKQAIKVRDKKSAR